MLARIVMVALLLTLAAGCGVSRAKLNEAKSHVQEGLEVWKKGGKPGDLKSLSRPIEFNEAMWLAGDTLLSYETGAVTYDDRAKVARCETKLTIRTRKGQQKTETVFYDVTLESPVKIVSNPMP